MRNNRKAKGHKEDLAARIPDTRLSKQLCCGIANTEQTENNSK